MNRRKSEIAKKSITFLGHILSEDGNKPGNYNVEKIKKVLVPCTVRQVRGFLGLVGYYRQFIPRFSDHASPLFNLTKKGTKFEWTTACQEAFEFLKNALITQPILIRPDYTKPFILATDASDYAIAGILGQKDENVKE